MNARNGRKKRRLTLDSRNHARENLFHKVAVLRTKFVSVELLRYKWNAGIEDAVRLR